MIRNLQGETAKYSLNVTHNMKAFWGLNKLFLAAKSVQDWCINLYCLFSIPTVFPMFFFPLLKAERLIEVNVQSIEALS